MEATRVGAGSGCGAPGVNAKGALTLALAEEGLPRGAGTAGAVAAGRVAGLAGGGGAVAGRPAEAGSPLTGTVEILRGSLFGIVPLAATGGSGADGATLATEGGLPF